MSEVDKNYELALQRFFDDPNFKQEFLIKGSKAYALARNERVGTLCHGAKIETLGSTGFVLCQLGE